MYRAYGEWTSKAGKGEPDHPARLFRVESIENVREIYGLAFLNDEQVLLDIRALLRKKMQLSTTRNRFEISG